MLQRNTNVFLYMVVVIVVGNISSPDGLRRTMLTTSLHKLVQR